MSTGKQQIVLNIPLDAFKSPFPRSFSDLNTATAVGSNFYAVVQFFIKVAFDRSSKNGLGEPNFDDIMCDIKSGKYVKKTALYLEPLFASELGTTICEKHKKNLFELIIERTRFEIDYDKILDLARLRKTFLLGYIRVLSAQYDGLSCSEQDPSPLEGSGIEQEETLSLKYRAFSSIEQLMRHSKLLYLPSSWEAVKLDVFYHTKHDFALTCEHTSQEFISQYRAWLRANDLQDKETMLVMVEDSLFDFVSNYSQYMEMSASKLDSDDIYSTELNSLLREAVSKQKSEKLKDLIDFGILNLDTLAGSICRALGISSRQAGGDDRVKKFSVHYQQLASMDNMAGVRVFLVNQTEEDFQRKIIHQLALNSASMIGMRKYQLAKDRGDKTALRFAKETHEEDDLYGANFLESFRDRASTGQRERNANRDIPAAFEEEFENSEDEEAAEANARLDNSAAQYLQKLNNQMIEGDIARNGVELPLEQLHKSICSPRSYFYCAIRVAFPAGSPVDERPEIFDVAAMYSKEGPLHISNWSTSAFSGARAIGCCASQSTIKNYLKFPVSESVQRDDFSLEAFTSTEPRIEEPRSPMSDSESDDSQEERELDAILGNVPNDNPPQPLGPPQPTLIVSPFGLYELDKYSLYDWPAFVGLQFPWTEEDPFESSCVTIKQTSKVMDKLRNFLFCESEDPDCDSDGFGELDGLLDHQKLSHHQREILCGYSAAEKQAFMEIICSHPRTKDLLKFVYNTDSFAPKQRKNTCDARMFIRPSASANTRMSMKTNFDVIAEKMQEKRNILKRLEHEVPKELFPQLVDKYLESATSVFCANYAAGDVNLSGQSILAAKSVESKYMDTYTETFEFQDPLLSLQSNFLCYTVDALQNLGLTYNTTYFFDLMKVMICSGSEPKADAEFLHSMLKLNLMIIGQKAAGKTTLLNIFFSVFIRVLVNIANSSEGTFVDSANLDAINAWDESPEWAAGKTGEAKKRVELVKTWLTSGEIELRKKVETNHPGERWVLKTIKRKINSCMVIIGNTANIADEALQNRFVQISIGPQNVSPHSLLLSKALKSQPPGDMLQKRDAFVKFMRYLQVTSFILVKYLGTCATHYPEISMGEILLSMAVDCCSTMFPSLRGERRFLDRATQELNASTILGASVKLHYANNDSGKSCCTQYFDFKDMISTLWKLCFIDQDTCLRIVLANMRKYVKELLHELLCVAVNMFTVHRFPYPKGFDELSTSEYITNLKRNTYDDPRLFRDSFIQPDSPVPLGYKIYGPNNHSDNSHYAVVRNGEHDFRDRNYICIPYTLDRLAEMLASKYNGRISKEVIMSVLSTDMTKTMTCKVIPLELVEMVVVPSEGNRKFPKDQTVLVFGPAGAQYMLKSKVPQQTQQTAATNPNPFGQPPQFPAAAGGGMFGGSFGAVNPFVPQMIPSNSSINPHAQHLSEMATINEYPRMEVGDTPDHYFTFPVLKTVKNSSTSGRVYILAAFVDGDPVQAILRALKRHFTFATCVPPRLVTLETPAICDTIREATWIGTDPFRVPELTQVAKKHKLTPGSKDFRLLFKDQEAFFATMHYRRCGGDPRQEAHFIETNVYQHRPKEAHKLSSEELSAICKGNQAKRSEAAMLRTQIAELDLALRDYDRKYKEIFDTGNWKTHSELSAQLKLLFTQPSHYNLQITAADLRRAYWKRLELKKQLTIFLSYYPMQQGKEVLDRIKEFSSGNNLSQIIDEKYMTYLDEEIAQDELLAESLRSEAKKKAEAQKSAPKKPPPSPSKTVTLSPLPDKSNKSSRSPVRKTNTGPSPESHSNIEAQLQNMSISQVTAPPRKKSDRSPGRKTDIKNPPESHSNVDSQSSDVPRPRTPVVAIPRTSLVKTVVGTGLDAAKNVKQKIKRKHVPLQDPMQPSKRKAAPPQ